LARRGIPKFRPRRIRVTASTEALIGELKSLMLTKFDEVEGRRPEEPGGRAEEPGETNGRNY
jgi:hypothetical protein